MHRFTEDPVARKVARDYLIDHALSDDDAEAVANLFPVIELETTQTRAQGESVTLRRVHLVGPWEVVNQ